jgi:hypothetical protein
MQNDNADKSVVRSSVFMVCVLCYDEGNAIRSQVGRGRRMSAHETANEIRGNGRESKSEWCIVRAQKRAAIK